MFVHYPIKTFQMKCNNAVMHFAFNLLEIKLKFRIFFRIKIILIE